MKMGYDNLKLEKGMYRQEGMSFTQVLESLDPSENYRGTALEGTDAFQRQLKRFGIRAKGAGSSPVEKFFRTMDSAVLFPEYIARTVRQGMEENDILPNITATTTVIDAMDYRSIYSVPTDEDKELQDVEEGAQIPETEVKTKEHLVSLTKRGRMLVASYEALRFQKLDLFGVMLRQIGAHIQKQQLMDAVNVLKNGDGNDNAAAVFTVGSTPISGTKGTLGYDQLVEFWGQFDPYTMNTLLCSTNTMTKMLKIPELQNPLTGLNFQGTGKLTTPLGAQLHRTSAVADGVIIGLDNRYALEQVRAGDVLVEYDKLIDRQLERAAITSIAGFGKICDGAACVLNV
ncbi:MAG: phage major capsid protein [Oscillospiraceae bacterium]|nr:phage major capsid protein [Oscillospiraceae bacterium]